MKAYQSNKPEQKNQTFYNTQAGRLLTGIGTGIALLAVVASGGCATKQPEPIGMFLERVKPGSTIHSFIAKDYAIELRFDDIETIVHELNPEVKNHLIYPGDNIKMPIFEKQYMSESFSPSAYPHCYFGPWITDSFK